MKGGSQFPQNIGNVPFRHAAIPRSQYVELSSKSSLVTAVPSLTPLQIFSGATAHSSCVAGGVDGLLPPDSEAEQMLLIHMQYGRPHGVAIHLSQQFLHWHLSRTAKCYF